MRGRGPGALVGRIDVEDLDPSRGSVVDEKVLGGAELDEDGSRASGLVRWWLVLLHGFIAVGTWQGCRRLVLLHGFVASGAREWCRW